LRKGWNWVISESSLGRAVTAIFKQILILLGEAERGIVLHNI
jgi:hypothetical protein